MTDIEPTTFRTKTGRIITEAQIEAWADEAERGYDPYQCADEDCAMAFISENAMNDHINAVHNEGYGL